MKHALILISLLTWPLQAELDSPAKEWDFAVAQKTPIILHAGGGEVVPAMPTLAGGALFFTDCSATGRAPCQNIYRLTAADTQPQRVVEIKEVQRLFMQGNKVFAQLATDTLLYVLQDDKLVPWKMGERSQAEAGARFHLHALASSDASLPSDV